MKSKSREEQTGLEKMLDEMHAEKEDFRSIRICTGVFVHPRYLEPLFPPGAKEWPFPVIVGVSAICEECGEETIFTSRELDSMSPKVRCRFCEAKE